MRPALLSPMLYGKYCTVRMPNGKEYRRVTRYCKQDGLYVVIATKRYFEYEMKISINVRKENDHV